MSPWLSDLFLRSQTDERLVALARLGHERAITAIVERYRRALLAYARRLDPERAEDLVQQTFLSALTALQAGTEVRHLRGWLYEILRNAGARGLAAPTAFSELTDGVSFTESAQEAAERRMLAVDALGAVAQLPPRQHNALLQIAIHGRNGSDVADAMGMSEGALRQLVHRARSTVRTAVTAIIPFPIIRWLCNPRAPVGAGLSEAALTAGTASTAGVAMKLGVGALVATGLVAGGVVSAVSLHGGRTAPRVRPIAARLSTDGTGSAAAIGRAAPGRSGSALAGTGAPLVGRTHHTNDSSTGQPSRHRRAQGVGVRSGDGSGNGSPGPRPRSGSHDGSGSGSGSRSGSGEHGGGSGSSPGGTGSSGSDGGSSGSRSDGGGGSSGSDGGGLPGGTVASGSNGGSGGSDGGSSGSVSSGSSGGSDGGTSSGSDGSSGGGSGATGSSSSGSSSDGGSGSGDGGQTTSGSSSGSSGGG